MSTSVNPHLFSPFPPETCSIYDHPPEASGMYPLLQSGMICAGAALPVVAYVHYLNKRAGSTQLSNYVERSLRSGAVGALAAVAASLTMHTVYSLCPMHEASPLHNVVVDTALAMIGGYTICAVISLPMELVSKIYHVAANCLKRQGDL